MQPRECFRGFYRLDRLRLRHRQFDGSMGREISRELFVRHDAVCVKLPYDPQRDCVVLIEQFRRGDAEARQPLAAGAGRRPDRQGTSNRRKWPIARRWRRPG